MQPNWVPSILSDGTALPPLWIWPSIEYLTLLSGSFSFYPTKQITTGEGGVVITNNEKFYKKIKKFKAFGIDKDIKDRKKQGDYDVKSIGYNYRMTDFQAALGYRQIINYHKNLKARHLIAKRYIKNFSKTDKIIHMPYSATSSFFVFQIFCKNIEKILKKLKKKKDWSKRTLY